MHYWPSKQILRASKVWDVKKVLANRPKGLTDEEWNAIVKEEKLNKLVVLDAVPKASRKSGGPKRPSNEE